MRGWAFLVATGFLLAAVTIQQGLSRAEPQLSRRAFAEFPRVLGAGWVGRDEALEPDVLRVLRLTDYLLRAYSYVPRDREPADRFPRAASDGTPHSSPLIPHGSPPVWLYIGYYASQGTGSTYHSPRNCLPGAGWQIVRSEQVPIEDANLPRPIHINKVIVQKGMDKEVILYWYHDRGRVIASEYRAKLYLLWDAVMRHRTDGALVRISASVSGSVSEEEAYQRAVAFLSDVWPVLDEYLPAAEQAPARPQPQP